MGSRWLHSAQRSKKSGNAHQDGDVRNRPAVSGRCCRRRKLGDRIKGTIAMGKGYFSIIVIFSVYQSVQ